MPKPQGNTRYMPGLDGLRAIAVLAVIAYHLHLSWAPGGLLGVGVFFVLSGYLITDLLVTERKQTGRLNMKKFWLRRARRLLPGLLLMLVVVVAWVTLFDRSQLWSLRGDVLAAILYVSNWWLIFHHVSYFQSFGPPSPLGHLWSLAVEEQFYLVWPLVLGLSLFFTRRRGWLVGMSLAGAAASALTMAVLYQPGTDPSRVYYGTDTRAFALLIGAALAFVWPSHKLSDKISRLARFAIDLVGTVGLLTIALMIWKTNQYQPFLYRGGFVLLSILTAAAVLALAHPASLLARVLGWKPLRWLGVRSYGIYLWHYPVIVLTDPVVNTGGVSVPRAILQVTASIILAALSWKFIEDPIRRGALSTFFKQIKVTGLRASIAKNRGWIASMGALVPLTIAFIGLAMPLSAPASELSSITSIQPPKEGLALQGPQSSSPSQGAKHGVSNTAGQGSAATSQNSPSPGSSTAGVKPSSGTQSQAPNSMPSSPTGANNTVQNQTPQPVSHMAGNPGQAGAAGTPTISGMSSSGTGNNPAAIAPQSGQGMTAIGDSVMIDISPYLKQLFPGIVIDAQVGRQMIEIPSVIQQLKAAGNLGQRVVIIELGTNGPFTANQLKSALQSLGSVKQIILVNTREPRPWESVVNSTLAQVAASYPHTTLVNWYAASSGKSYLFYPDGVHLNPQGAQYYANLVARAVYFNGGK